MGDLVTNPVWAARGRTLESVYMAPELCDDVQTEEVQDLK